jgi:hypothetical protein
MDVSSINWLAVIGCVVASMVSGMIWYNPGTFFTIWWKGIGKTGVPGQQGGSMAVTWILTVLSSLVQGVFMAMMVTALGGLMGGPTIATGLLTGLMLWAGFIAPTYLVNKLFAGHGFKVWAIEAGNHLVNFLAFGAILGAWR